LEVVGLITLDAFNYRNGIAVFGRVQAPRVRGRMRLVGGDWKLL
jgi:hypothetical protein